MPLYSRRTASAKSPDRSATPRPRGDTAPATVLPPRALALAGAGPLKCFQRRQLRAPACAEKRRASDDPDEASVYRGRGRHSTTVAHLRYRPSATTRRLGRAKSKLSPDVRKTTARVESSTRDRSIAWLRHNSPNTDSPMRGARAFRQTILSSYSLEPLELPVTARAGAVRRRSAEAGSMAAPDNRGCRRRRERPLRRRAIEWREPVRAAAPRR